MLGTITLSALALLPSASMQGKGGGQGAALPPARQLFANFSFTKLDADKDGGITAEELTRATFAWLDRNDDAHLDRNELARLPGEKSSREESRERDEERRVRREKEKEKDAAPASKPSSRPARRDAERADDAKEAKDSKDAKESGDAAKAHLERCDADKDGKVARAEFALPEAWFTRADVDSDGKISQDEFLGKASRDNGKGMRAIAGKSPADALLQLDANRDGSISAEEWSGNPKVFERADENGDGSLSKDELTKIFERMKKARGKEAKGDGADEKPDSKETPPR